MEISAMITEVKSKIEKIESENTSLSALRDKYYKLYTDADEAIRSNQDDLDAFRVALEGLEMVGLNRKEEPKADPVPEEKPEAKPVKPPRESGKHKAKVARKVVKYDSYGNQIGIFRSISECARTLNIGAQSIINMIEKGDKASMLANRGYYLTYTTN